MEDELDELTVLFEAATHDFATWNSPAPHWTEEIGPNGRPIYRGRCDKKVYRTFAHAAADARTLRFRDDRRDAPEAYWCRRCRGFHVGRSAGSMHERVLQIRPGTELRAA